MSADRPRTASVWIGYTALRLLLFAVPFLVIWGLGGDPSLSAALAAVIGLALSVVLLDRRRSALGGLIAERVRRREPATDESVEDLLVEGGAPQRSGGSDGATDGGGGGTDASDQPDSAAASPRP